MKKYAASVLGLVLFFALQGFAQEHYTEGPIWQVTLIRVKPTQMDAYLTTLRATTKKMYDEMKKDGTILDYKVFLNTTQHDPQDWDMAIGVQYKNFAALDGLAAINGGCAGQGSRIQTKRFPTTRRKACGDARHRHAL